ncbi:MAG: peptidoglycan-binding protein [Archangiaceae bacterium]|nr:peptidoglycan-binding protein [Archangiaceae bacterium]
MALSLAACSHARDAKRDDAKEDGGGKAKGKPAPKEGAKESPKAAGRRTTTPDRNAKKSDPRAPKLEGPAEPMTTSKTTRKMFKTEGLKKLQETLAKQLVAIGKKNDQVANEKKDAVEKEKEEQKVPLADLDGVDMTGDLDARTQEGLRAFQRSEQLPETGLPDYETLRRLHISPDELYHHEPPAKREGIVQ